MRDNIMTSVEPVEEAQEQESPNQLSDKLKNKLGVV